MDFEGRNGVTLSLVIGLFLNETRNVITSIILPNRQWKSFVILLGEATKFIQRIFLIAKNIFMIKLIWQKAINNNK